MHRSSARSSVARILIFDHLDDRAVGARRGCGHNACGSAGRKPTTTAAGASGACSRSSIRAHRLGLDRTACRRRGSGRRRRSRPARPRPGGPHGRCRAAAPGRRPRRRAPRPAARPARGRSPTTTILRAGAKLVDAAEQMVEHRPPGDRMQHLVQIGLHPRALAGGEDRRRRRVWPVMARHMPRKPCHFHSGAGKRRPMARLPLRRGRVRPRRHARRHRARPGRGAQPYAGRAGAAGGGRRSRCGHLVGHGAQGAAAQGPGDERRGGRGAGRAGLPDLPRLLRRQYLRRHRLLSGARSRRWTTSPRAASGSPSAPTSPSG